MLKAKEVDVRDPAAKQVSAGAGIMPFTSSAFDISSTSHIIHYHVPLSRPPYVPPPQVVRNATLPVSKASTEELSVDGASPPPKVKETDVQAPAAKQVSEHARRLRQPFDRV